MPSDAPRRDAGAQVNKSEFWNSIYVEQESPRWNLGHSAPPLKYWLENAGARPGRVLIPGCGYGHDVKLLAEHGFNAIGVDFAPLAIERGRKVLDGTPGEWELRQADIFDLPASERGTFDYIYEYTCFVAIEPPRRSEYVQVKLDLLKPGGILIGCFYNHGREGGPPFDVTREEVLKLYEPHFGIRKLEVSRHSIERRLGHELWAEFVRP